jgi:hypothetical protein
MKGNDDMKIPSSAVARNLEFHLGLMQKQIKRVAELARFLPFADQQEEMNTIVKPLGNETTCLKSILVLWGDPGHNPKGSQVT